MGSLSSKLTTLTFGTGALAPKIQRCTINSSGDHGTTAGNDAGPDIIAGGSFKATKIWNAVWNDVADFQLLNDRLEFGKCYIDTKEGAQIATERCQKSVIGIASDTFGYGVGTGANPENEVPIAVGGWVLAQCDQEYECGTALTCDENGNLTAMTRDEKLEYPERLVAIYKRKEMDKKWGPVHAQIEVNDRHWVKVK